MQVIIKPKCVEKNGFAPSADAQTTACSLSHQCMPRIHSPANLPMEKKTEEDSMTSTSSVVDFMLRLASCTSEPPRTPSLQVYGPGFCNPHHLHPPSFTQVTASAPHESALLSDKTGWRDRGSMHRTHHHHNQSDIHMYYEAKPY